MREYELTIIIQPEISDEGSAALFERLDKVLETGGAIRLLCDDLGKRKLAYEIQKFHKGHYYILYFLDEGKVVPEIERTLRMDESVLRFLTILANEEVDDVDARRVEAREREVELQKRAAERAAREAEEAAARAEAEERAREEAAEAAAAAESAEAAAAAESAEAEAAAESAEAPAAAESAEAPAAAESAEASEAESDESSGAGESTSETAAEANDESEGEKK